MARVNIIEWIAKKLKSLTGIVEDGDTATHAISTGKYVIWKGNPRKASSAISIGDALSSSNLTALTDGVCNDLADAKVNKTDIVDNLTTNDSTKALSAAQGYALNSKLPTLLWTNPSVSATGESTIAQGINFNNFTLFAVKTRVNVGVQRYIIQLVYIGEETQISYVTDNSTQNANVWYRYITINNGRIYVTNATRGDGTNNTSALIPEALYGIM